MNWLRLFHNARSFGKKSRFITVDHEFCIVMACLIFWVSFAALYGIESAQQNALHAFADRQKTEMESERQQALQLAKQFNWPMRSTTADGLSFELQGMQNGRPIYYVTHNKVAAFTVAVDKIRPDGLLGYALTGKKQTLAMWDNDKVNVTHREFAGRVQQQDSGSEITTHASHVAGTLVAGGVTPAARGMANQAQLKAYTWGNDLAEMAASAASDVLLSNHSYGPMAGWTWNFRNDTRFAWFGDPAISETEDYQFGYYSERARKWDELIFTVPQYVVVASAGNDRDEYGPTATLPEHWVFKNSEWVLSSTIRDADGGSDGYDSINGFAVAKNIITVGGVQALPWPYKNPSDVQMTGFSCWGPTDDGRIKPDLVADGVFVYSTARGGNDMYATLSGSSQAAPGVTGAIALLKEQVKNLTTAAVLASTWKALLIHTAREAGENPGPDYQFGWGLLNAAEAAKVITQHFASGGSLYVRELTLNNKAKLEFQITSDGLSPLKLTLCWTDPAGPELSPALNNSTANLINDLDLRAIGPSAGDNLTWMPWILDPSQPGKAAAFGDNVRDNVEQVYIANPAAGIYTVRINHKATLKNGPQKASVVITGAILPAVAAPAAPALLSPAANASVNADSVILDWSKINNAAGYRVQVAYDQDFHSLFSQENGIIVDRYPLHNLLANTTLYWRVQAYNAGGSGAFSTIRKFTVGENGAILAWEKITPVEYDVAVNAVISDSLGHVFACMSFPRFLPNYLELNGTYRTTDHGLTWEQVDWDYDKLYLTRKGCLLGVNTDIYEVGRTGGIRDAVFHIPGHSPKDLSVDENNGYYVLCNQGEVYSSADAGAHWTLMGHLPVSPDVNGQSIRMHQGVLYATTWGAGLFRSPDSGKTWQDITANLATPFVYTVNHVQNGKLICGTAAGLYTCSSDTVLWKWLGGEIGTAKVTSLILGPKGDVYAGSYGCQGPGDGVFVSLDHGENWTTVHEGLHLLSARSLYLTTEGDLYAGIGHGDPSLGGAVYYSRKQNLLQAAARKLSVIQPGQVVLTTPLNNLLLPSLHADLSWKSVSQAAVYQIQVSTSADFKQNVLDTTIAFTSLQMIDLKSATRYYWRVCGQNALYSGVWSNIGAFHTKGATEVVANDEAAPLHYELGQNYPNPFNPTTTLYFTVKEPGPVLLHVFDHLGRKTASLVNQRYEPGRYTVRFSAKGLASGVYFYRIQMNDFCAVKKMVLVR